jgi:protease-4
MYSAPPIPPPIPGAPRRCGHGRFYLIIVLLSVALGLSLLWNAGRKALGDLQSGWKTAGLGQPEDQYPQFEEIHSYGQGDAKVVRIPVQGVIIRAEDSGLFGVPVDMTDTVLRQIRAASNDDEVRAILLEIDSPGGAITPTDEIASALRAFQESREDRRVVAFVRDLAASGGYYVAAGADRILAEPTAMVGSISVILQTLNWHPLSERIGVTDLTIKSGRNKDLLNPFRPVPPEQVAMLQRMVDDLHTRFVDVVREGRKLDAGQAEALADGSVFTAAEAMERGLVDSLGHWEDAIRLTAEVLDEEEVRLVRYQTRTSFWEVFATMRSPVRLPVTLTTRGPRAWVLWQP